MSDENLTSEQIQKQYDAAMDSVNLLNSSKPEGFTDSDWTDHRARNVEHLEIMVAKLIGLMHKTLLFSSRYDANS